MIRNRKPAIRWFTSFSLVLAFLLAAVQTGSAAQINATSGRAASSVVSPSNLRLVQTYSQQTITTVKPGGNTGGRTPPNGSTSVPPSGGGKRPSGGGVSINLGTFLKPPVYTPPKRVYRPPVKKVYRPKTPSKTARRPAWRRPPSTVSVVQPIPQFIADQVTALIRNQPASVDNEIAQAFGLTVISSTPVSLLEGRIVTFRLPRGGSLPQIISSVRSDPRVELAGPNSIYLTVQQRARKASGGAQYALAKLNLGNAHTLARGRGIPVAVIDTGVDATHPALSKSVGQTYDAVADGRTGANDHGTAIAGLIAGQGKVTGVAPEANILAVRSFYMHPQYKRPLTSTDTLVKSFDWAFTNGARIFNMSFTGPYDPLVKAALEAAHKKGIVLVAAAGNGGPKAPPAYPAAYPGVIAITATDQRDRLYAHANRGGYLAAAAPGVDVLVPALKKGYTFSSGTSMAAAHISGLVALLLERNPDATPADIEKAIKSTALDLGPKGPDVQFGAGRANAHASLMSLASGKVKLTSGQ